MLLLALVLPGSATRPFSAHSADLPPLRAEHAPYFTADVAISLDSLGHPALSVSVAIPYQELQWIRLPQGFGAGAEITVVLEPRGPGRLFGDVWERRIVVPSFSVTVSPNASVTERRVFSVPPDRYQARVQVRDVNAEQGSTARSTVVVPDYSKVPVGFSDLELGTADSTGGFTPVLTRRFGLEVRSLAARVSLFDRRSGPWPRTYPFRYRILDELGEELLSGTQQVTIAHSAAPVVVKPNAPELFLGSYVFAIELNQDKSRWRVDRSFEVEESGPPRGKEFERMLEVLSFIAEQKEIDQLRALPAEQQPAGWEAFWHRRDPTPETPRNEAEIEFFRRVRYTEQHFHGFGPGWRSDQGRIYIKFGPPDQIESRPATTQSPQLEIWTYNQPYRRFVFADREGFGRFVLVGPASE